MMNLLRIFKKDRQKSILLEFSSDGINWWRLQRAALQMRGNHSARSLNYVWMPWQYIISLARYFAFLSILLPQANTLYCRNVEQSIKRSCDA